MLVFGAIVPHSPLLLPVIGKEHHSRLKKTLDALKTLEEDLYAAKPDTLVIISPHGPVLDDAFSLFIAPKFQGNLREFGDLKTAVSFPADVRVIEKIRKLRIPPETLPIVSVTEDFVDYGVTVPLHLLASHLPNIHAVPLGVSRLPIKTHFTVGARLGEALHEVSARIAILASADLAHTLRDDAPGGFSPDGKKFDETVVQGLRKNTPDSILKLEKNMDAAKACGLRPIAMLLGAVSALNATPEPLSYEGPFGVGYLTARYNLR